MSLFTNWWGDHWCTGWITIVTNRTVLTETLTFLILICSVLASLWYFCSPRAIMAFSALIVGRSYSILSTWTVIICKTFVSWGWQPCPSTIPSCSTVPTIRKLAVHLCAWECSSGTCHWYSSAPRTVVADRTFKLVWDCSAVIAVIALCAIFSRCVKTSVSTVLPQFAWQRFFRPAGAIATCWTNVACKYHTSM